MHDRLAILLTNIWLAERGGSQTVIRDLSLGLLRRGHRPIVYSPSLGESADELIEKGIVVIDDLRKLAEPPDLIHAHHSIPCGEALIRFPATPAIFTCHAFAHWVETPVHFPQIAAYVAVDEACRDRLVQAEGIDPARVLVLRNAVDLTRIPARPRPLMDRPKRAIAFGKAAAVPELRRACEKLGIAFEAISYANGRPSACPEQALVEADMVFASARSALEALCCGCAVIVCDERGSAGMVTSENVGALRERNFGLRSFGEPMTIERCIRETERYDAVDAARVSERMRQEADLQNWLDGLQRLYAEVLSEERRPHTTREAHEQAVARFLNEYLPRRPADPRWPWMAQREDMLRHIERLEAQLAEGSERLAEAERSADETRRVFEARLSETHNSAERARQALEARLAEVEQAADESRRGLEGRLAEAEHAAAQARQALEAQVVDIEGSKADVQRELAKRTIDSSQHIARLRRELNEARSVLAEAQRAADQTGQAREARAVEAERSKADAQRELARRTIDFSQHMARLRHELDEARSALSEASRKLADLKRSRMLRLGRVLRRIAGRPIAY